MSFNQGQFPGFSHHTGYMSINPKDFPQYLEAVRLMNTQFYLNYRPSNIFKNPQLPFSQMNRQMVMQRTFPPMRIPNFNQRPEFEFGNTSIPIVSNNAQANLIKRIPKPQHSSNIIVISDDQDNNTKQQIKNNEPSLATEVKNVQQEPSKTVKIKKDKKIKKIKQIKEQVPQVKKPARKKIEYINKGERKSERKIKLKQIQPKMDQPEEKYKMQLVNKSRVGFEYQTQIPSFFQDVGEMQLWINEKKNNLFKRHLN